MKKIQIDIYRNGSLLFLHKQGIRCNDLPMPPLNYGVNIFAAALMSCFLLLGLIAAFIENPIVGFVMLGMFSGFVFLMVSVFSKGESLVIGRDFVRSDWWNHFGYVRSQKSRRETDFTVTVECRLSNRQAYYLVKIQNGNHSLKLPAKEKEQAEWVVATIQEFLAMVPCSAADELSIATPIPPPQKTDADAAPNLLKTLSWKDETLSRLAEWDHETECSQMLQGALYVRCQECHKVIPQDHINLDTALCGCPSCEKLFEILPLKQSEPSTGWPKLSIERNEQTLTIRQKNLDLNPAKCVAVAWISVMCFVLFLLIYKLIFEAKSTLTPQQFNELLYGWPHVLSIVILVAGLGVLGAVVSLCMVLYRFQFEITPERCTLRVYIAFWGRSFVIPRTEVRRFFGTNKRNNGYSDRFVCRNDSWLHVAGGDQVKAAINRYLLTVPPAEKRPFEPDDETWRFASCGEEESESVAIEMLDAETLKPLPYHEALPKILEAATESQNMLRFPFAPLVSNRITVKNDATELHIQVGKEPAKSRQINDFWFPVGLLTFLLCFFSVGGMVSLFNSSSQSELGRILFVTGLFGVFGVGMCLLLFYCLRDEYRCFDAEWELKADEERLTLLRRFRGWEDEQTFDRKEILGATIQEKPMPSFRKKIPSMLQAGSVTLTFRDGKTVRLPDVPTEQGCRRTTNSQAIANLLNRFFIH